MYIDRIREGTMRIPDDANLGGQRRQSRGPAEAPKAFVLYDTLRNAAERVGVHFNGCYYRVRPGADPESAATGYDCAIRGGNATFPGLPACASAGDHYPQTMIAVGFRCVME